MAANYTILAQKQNVQINPAGTGFENVWEITYRVTNGPGKGTIATLTVPEDDHNAQYIGKAIEDKISNVHEIAQLGGQS